MTFTESSVPTSFGPVALTETGPADAPAVVLLHGWPQNASERWSSLWV
ncbi:hypothetical protein [Rhodococcoides trifolii]|nr:hypothetical protein [Rhodococcus trifolii]